MFNKLRATSSSETFDFLFHDGGHSGDDYVSDYQQTSAMLRSGAVMIIDDIRLDDGSAKQGMRSCYEGWLEIVRSDRVTFAAEIDTDIGIVRLD